MEELEGGTRLVRWTLLDDRLCKSLVTVDEDLQSYTSVLSFFVRRGQCINENSYRFTFTKRHPNYIAVLLGPLCDLWHVAIAQLR